MSSHDLGAHSIVQDTSVWIQTSANSCQHIETSGKATGQHQDNNEVDKNIIFTTKHGIHTQKRESPGHGNAPNVQSAVLSSDETPQNENTENTSANSQVSLQNDEGDLPPPIASTNWQHKSAFQQEGGELRKPGSDVMLRVPSGAVNKDTSVVIHTAVCADVDRVHNVLELSDEYQTVSPLAEYWAGPDFSFQRPVCITLPLCLPPDPDLSLLRVYRVSRRHNGHVITNMVKQQEDNPSDCTSARQDIGNTHTEGQQQQVGYMWEESEHYEVSSEGRVLVTTDHFCGYVCVYCGRSQGPPELVAMVYGCHTRLSSLQRLASVDLYIWDKRVDIGDFRQEYDIGLTGSKVGRTAVSLLDEVKDTKLHAQIHTLGAASSHWTHLQRSDGRPGNPEVQNRDVKMIVSCDAYGCSRKKSAPPSLVQWRLVAPVDLVTETSLLAVLDIAHVTDDAVPAWTDRHNAESVTFLQIQMQESRCNQDVNESEGHNMQLSLTALSTDQLQMILQRVDMESYQRIMQTAHRYKREDDFKKQLIEVLCRQNVSFVMKVFASLLFSTSDRESVPRKSTPPLNNYSPANMPAEATDGDLPNRTVSPLDGMSFQNRFSESQAKSIDVPPCSDHSNPDTLDMTSDNGMQKKGSASEPGQQLTPWQNSDFPSCPETRSIHGDGKESNANGAKISERIMRESHVTADQDGRCSGVVRETKEQHFSDLPTPLLKCLNSSQELSLTGLPSSTDDKDAIFEHVEKGVIVRVAKLLPVDKSMLFFLDLELSSQQYEVAKQKHGTAFEQVNMECFIMLGRCGKQIDVDTLTKALDNIDRLDIIQDIQDLGDSK